MTKVIARLKKLKFYTTKGLLSILGGRVSQSMLEYIRDTVGLIPSPIKIGTGKGTIALYPDFVASHLQRILAERNQGYDYWEISERFEESTEAISLEMEHWKRFFSAHKAGKEALLESLRTGNQPASSFKIDLKDSLPRKAVRKTEKDSFKRELKKLCASWDGKSMYTLKDMKVKIEALERIEATEKIILKLE